MGWVFQKHYSFLKTRNSLKALIFLALVSLILLLTQIGSYFQGRGISITALGKQSGNAMENSYDDVRAADFPGPTLVKSLDSRFLPRASDSAKHDTHEQRLIFIGDIHGCKTELLSLLEASHYSARTDHIITTGDIIHKGPDSLGVVDFLMEHGASCVRGNHEDNILRLREQMANPVSSDHNGSAGSNPELETKEEKLARALSDKQLEYLKAFPLILRVGRLEALASNVVVVHGGLVPGMDLDKQDPYAIMNMRIIDLKTRTPSEDHKREGSLPWFEVWNSYQNLLPSRGPESEIEHTLLAHTRTTVIYGHDAKKGLQIYDYTKGLDSSCVRGGELTALIVGPGSKSELIQVKCKNYRSN